LCRPAATLPNIARSTYRCCPWRNRNGGLVARYLTPSRVFPCSQIGLVRRRQRRRRRRRRSRASADHGRRHHLDFHRLDDGGSTMGLILAKLWSFFGNEGTAKSASASFKTRSSRELRQAHAFASRMQAWFLPGSVRTHTCHFNCVGAEPSCAALPASESRHALHDLEAAECQWLTCGRDWPGCMQTNKTIDARIARRPNYGRRSPWQRNRSTLQQGSLYAQHSRRNKAEICTCA
jgi:hypothetical protein